MTENYPGPAGGRRAVDGEFLWEFVSARGIGILEYRRTPGVARPSDD